VLGSMTSEQLSEFKQFGDRVSRDSSFSTTVAADAREATEIASRLNASATRTTRAEAALAQRTSYSERLATALERGEVISIDVAQDPHNLAMFTRYAEQYGGTSAAAQALFEAELARRALGPNRTFTDGTGVPVTFGSLPPEHLRQSAIVDSTVDVASMRRDSDAAVRRTRGNPLPPTAPAESPEPRRDQMQAEATALRQRAGAQADQLGRNIDADRAEDGTLVPRRSLLKQSAKQVGKDAATTAESAVDAVKDLLKRK
jgi:conjugal transfer mating pair stabilization protein TraG